MEQTFKIISSNIIQNPLLTMEEAKRWLRVEHSKDDGLISDLILTAYHLMSNYCKSTFLVTDYMVDFLATDCVELPMQPIVKVGSVVDGDGNPLDYSFNGMSTVCVEGCYTDTFRISYQAGSFSFFKDYALRSIILNIIAMLYEHRGDTEGLDLSQIHGIDNYKLKVW